MISKSFSLKSITRRKLISSLRRLKCKDKKKKYLKKYLVKSTKWLKSTINLSKNSKCKPNKLEKSQLHWTKGTKVMKNQKNNLKRFLVNLTILTICSEMWHKEQASMAKLIKFLPKFFQIWKDLLLHEKCRLNNFKTVLRKVDLEQVRTFQLCIQIRLLLKILDFSFLHQWYLQITLKNKTWTNIRVMIWATCWQILWDQNQILEEMFLKDQFINQNGNDNQSYNFLLLINISEVKKL